MQSKRWRRSFRLHMALLFMLASGALLAAFGLSAWVLLRSAKVAALDAAVGGQMRGGVFAQRLGERFQRLENALVPSYGEQALGAVRVLAGDDRGQILYRSARWPAGLTADRLPEATPLRPSRPPDGPPGGPPGPPPDGPPEAGVARRFVTLRADGQSWRVLAVQEGGVVVALAADLGLVSRAMAPATQAFGTAALVALALVGVLGWLVSDRALRPVRKLTVTAERIDVTALRQRIRGEGEDAEFARLIEVFNGMLERLEKSFAQARRFSADAAHELRTPLAVLQGELEAGLQAAEEGSADQQRYATLLEEVQRLKSIVSNLLTLSLADAGKLRATLTLHDLSSTVAELVEELEIIAEGVRVAARVPEGIWVMADPGMVTQVIRNLGTNAVRHNRRDGEVEVELRETALQVELRVSNSGGGIRQEDAERVFERFYRGDKSRGRDTDGAGLGLSLSRELMRAQGGDLVLEVSQAGRTTLLATLPRASRAG